MGQIFKILKKARNKKAIKRSEEYTFFKKFKGMLKSNAAFNKYLDIEDDFDIVKANIIIRSIINKEELDSIIDEEYVTNQNESTEKIKKRIKERICDLPYIKYGNYKVYVPFFNKSTNIVYGEENEKVFQYPYISLAKKYDSFIIDPFESYNVDLFSSLFTQLVKIDESFTSVAFYHYDFNAIVIINKQGTVDNVIYLFDKYMKNPHKYNIIDKVKPLVQAYYNNDFNHFVYLLYKNDLISYHVFRKICKTSKL